MNSLDNLRIEPLGDHDRSKFACGHPALDEWFRLRAGQDQHRSVSRVFLAVDDVLGVVGFFTLSSFAIIPDELPVAISRKLPRYQVIPATLIGRFATDRRVQGKGVGRLLIAEAIRRVLDVATSVAVFAIVIDAKDETAAEFYKRVAFQAFPQQPMRLYLLASTAADGLRSA